MAKKIIYAVIFIMSLIMVTKGKLIDGYTGLFIMLLGLALILFELYLYNKKNQ